MFNWMFDNMELIKGILFFINSLFVFYWMLKCFRMRERADMLESENKLLIKHIAIYYAETGVDVLNCSFDGGCSDEKDATSV